MIEAVNLTKRFDKFTALDHINCTIPSGCIYGMVGSNGAGKSTFLRILNGIYRPDEGELLVDGEPVYENPAKKNKIAFVPDDWYYLPGSNMIRMAELYRGIYKDFDKKRFYELADAFNLDPKKNLNTFSKGMRRQAAILLAVSSRPDYLVLDETFDGLDPIMRTLVKSMICEDVAERNATAILSSHSLRELEDTCDQLALLHKGGVVLQNDISNLKTTLFKVQVAFPFEYGKNDFTDMQVLHYTRMGSVANMIVKGDREKTIAQLKGMNPLLLDILPLTLEEVFTYELEALGYFFDYETITGGMEDMR